MEKHDHQNQKKTGNETPELLFDLIEEILIRLPIKSLLRFRCVCKEWNSLIQENNDFIKKHMSRATPVLVEESHFICHSEFKTTTHLHHANSFGLDRGFSTLAISEGLVVENLSDRFFTIRNPATRKVLHLPRPPGNNHRMWFNFSSSRLLCEHSVLEHVLETEKDYKLLKIGDNWWRPLDPDGKEESVIVSKDQEKMFFTDLVPLRCLQPKEKKFEYRPSLRRLEGMKPTGPGYYPC